MQKQQLLAGVLALTMTGGLMGLAAQAEPMTLDTFSGNPIARMDVRTQQTITEAAVQAYKQIITAREALSKKEFRTAEVALKEAIIYLNQAQTFTPTERIKNQLWVAKKHLEMDSVEMVKADLIPVETALMESPTVGRYGKAPEFVAQARTALMAGNKPQARDYLQQAENEVFFTEYAMPVGHAIKYVNEAQRFLSENRIEEAQMALRHSEEGVNFIAFAEQLPVASAERSLWQAATFYTMKDFPAAQRELSRSEYFINQCLTWGDEKSREVAGTILRDIREFNQRISDRDNFAPEQLTALYQRTHALTQYNREIALVQFDHRTTGETPTMTAAQFDQARWGMFRFSQPEQIAAQNLVRARLDLSLAESYQLTGNNAPMAQARLQQAETYLKEAAMNAPMSNKATITTLQSNVKLLQTGMNDRPDTVRMHYNKNREELQRLIRQM